MGKALFKYIAINTEPTPPHVRTLRYTVINRRTGDTLGIIQWRTSWRAYCFEPAFPTVFEHVCLRDISEFIEAATAVHKAMRRK